MVTVTPKNLVTMKLRGKSQSHARMDIKVRDIETIVDEPTERGGTNLGPTPTEFLIIALVSCTNVVGHRVAKKNGVEVKDMSVDVEALFDRRGAAVIEPVDIPFKEIKMTITMTATGDDAAIAKMQAELGNYCPIEKTLTNAGTKVEKIWHVTAPAAA